jgi:hypothetical protein
MLLQKSSLQLPRKSTTQLGITNEEKVLSDHERFMAVMNLMYRHPNDEVITRGTLCTEMELEPRVIKVVLRL